MGFYGNITNAASTNFTFDITYSNRVAMDKNAQDDGVSIGRYVRVEYDEIVDPTALISVTQNNDDVWCWISNEIKDGKNILKPLQLADPDTKPTDQYVKPGQMVVIASDDDKINYGKVEYKDGQVSIDDNDTQPINYYEKNYQIDFDKYGASYDGTAWVKQFKNNKMVYTLVAELNTVVPTFEITPVAPTDNPQYPYFGPESTNLNYDLHIQPSWGLRIADIKNAEEMPSNVGGLWNSKICKIAGVSYNDSYITFNLYKKDLDSITDNTKSNWTISPYSDPKATYMIETIGDSDSSQLVVRIKPQDKTTTPENEYFTKFYNSSGFIIINQKYTGGIYYNAAGFNPDERSRINDPTNVVTLIDECSGTKYLNPANGKVEAVLPDTKGLVINLPSIGNAVSDTYDLLYGVNRKNDPESLAGKLNDLDFSSSQENQLLLTNRYTRDDDGTQGVKFIPVIDTLNTSDKGTFDFIHGVVYEQVNNFSSDLYKPYTYYINDNGTYKLATKAFDSNKIYYLPKGKLDIKFDLHLKNGYGENSLVQYSYQDQLNSATGEGAAAFGLNTSASGDYSHAEGRKTKAIAANSHTEGYYTEAQGDQSHAEGHSTIASKGNSHAEGYSTIASGENSHAEGRETQASGNNSHVEGSQTQATNHAAHAEGFSTHSTGFAAHAEGYETTSSGAQSHAEGAFTQATEFNAHAEGYQTKATGNASHSEGYSTIASGPSAHAEGNNTIALGESQHVQGKYNVKDASKVHIVGWGGNDSARKNIHTIDTQGNAEFAGNISFGDNIPYLNGRNLSNIISGLEYEDIQLNNFTVAANNKTSSHNYEIGDNVTIKELSTEFSKTNKAYHNTTLTIEMQDEAGNKNVLVEPKDVEDKSEDNTIIYETIRKTVHGEYVTITATITDRLAKKNGAPEGSLSEKESTASQSVEINFYYKAFVFVGDEDNTISFDSFNHDSDFINNEYKIQQSKLLTNTKENSKGTYTWNTVTKPASGKQYVYVLSPKAATFFVGGFSGGFELVKENIVFNLPEGNETYTGYKLYRTIQPQSGDIKELKTVI